MSPLRYRLAMPEPHTHLLGVEVRLDPAEADTVRLAMPSWTPGSYLMREFARNVQNFHAAAEDGRALPWYKTDKSTWQIDTRGAAELVVRYRVYANELSVRTSHLDASHAAVNGASVFMLVQEREHEPIELRVDAPAGWTVDTVLPGAGNRTWRAEHYDQLVDCPLEVGTHQRLEWEIDGVPHRFAVWGARLDPEQAARLQRDTTALVRTARRLFGGLPYPEYLFILHLLPGGRGGLEHRASTVLQADLDALHGDAYERLLGLIAHEHFHVWNGKRIRPAPLGPFDYLRENYTRNLWVVEGFTTYYTDLLLRRSGLITPERYLQRLAESIGRLQALPGRHHQTLEESSWDAWIRFYRPDAHTPNAQVSYYQKGALVALLLDQHIRRATGGARSLDDLLRLLWTRYGKPDVGYPENPHRGIQALAEQIAGEPLEHFFERYVRGVEELDYQSALATVALRLEEADEQEQVQALTGTQPAPARPATVVGGEKALGLRVEDDAGRVRVTHVLAGTPAYEAGVNTDDEIAAVGGIRVAPGDLRGLLERLQPGSTVELAVFRRGRLLTLPVRIDPVRTPSFQIRPLRQPTPAQTAAYQAWIATDSTPQDLDLGGSKG